MIIETTVIIALISAISSIIGTNIIDKFLKKKSLNENFLSVIESINKVNNDNNISLNKSLIKLTDSIELMSSKIIAENKEKANIIVRKFSVELKNKFINEIINIFNVNHIEECKTINQIKSISLKLLNEFYSDVLSIDGISTFINDKDDMINLIEEFKLYDKVYNILLEAKHFDDLNKLLIERKISRSIYILFDEIFEICFTYKKEC